MWVFGFLASRQPPPTFFQFRICKTATRRTTRRAASFRAHPFVPRAIPCTRCQHHTQRSVKTTRHTQRRKTKQQLLPSIMPSSTSFRGGTLASTRPTSSSSAVQVKGPPPTRNELKHLQKKAAQRCPDSMLMLGSLHMTGTGVEEDIEKAGWGHNRKKRKSTDATV